MALDSTAGSWLDRRVNVRLVLASWAVLFLSALAPTDGGADDSSGGWTVVDRERGITSSRREQPGCCLPSFRGQGRVEGNVLQILAMLLDVENVPRWAFGTDEAKMLKRIDAKSELVYVYSDVQWPVRDRDMVVVRDIEVIKPGEQFRMGLRCVDGKKAERSGVVRIRDCRSNLFLSKAGPAHTDIDYTMSLDPAGHLPDWVSGWVSKTVPFKTLLAIESTAAAKQGQYAEVVKRWSTAM
jgi:hypothetical protein